MFDSKVIGRHVAFMRVMAQRRPVEHVVLAAIHAGDWLVKLLLMTVILGVWRKGRRDISNMSAVPHSPTLISEDRRR